MLNKNTLYMIDFDFSNTRYKLGVRIWGERESFRQLYELLFKSWDCGDDLMTDEERCSYLCVVSYFQYEIRHTFMCMRLVENEEDMENGKVGVEFPWPFMFFIMAAWRECLRHFDCPPEVLPVMRMMEEKLDQLLKKRCGVREYKALAPYLNGAIYAANPYLILLMEDINDDFLYGYSMKGSMSSLAHNMRASTYDNYQYDEFHKMLKREAKRNNCKIEQLTFKSHSEEVKL